MADNHTIRVVSLLNGDEYLNLRNMADEDGLSDSAFMRRLIKLEARRRAVAQLSDESRLHDAEEPAQVVHSAAATGMGGNRYGR